LLCTAQINAAEIKSGFLDTPEVVTSTFGDWSQTCRYIKNDDAKKNEKLCEATQSISVSYQNSDGSVSQPKTIGVIAIGKVKIGEPLLMTIVAPVDVKLPGQIQLNFENNLDKKTHNLTWIRCLQNACYAKATVTPEILISLKNIESTGVLSWQLANEQNISVKFSLKGFSQAVKLFE
jgi:invasion protein IalB